MEKSNDWIIVDGELVPAGTAVAPATSRGLMYGDGVFETLRTYSGQTLFFSKHLDRLKTGLDILGISQKNCKDGSLKSQIYKLLLKKNLLTSDAIVRIQFWRDGQRGYQPDPQAQSHFSITASPCPHEFSYPKLVTVDTRRIPSASLPSDAKFTNGINYILAAREAASKGGDDALMLTTDGFVSETTIANIFWVKEDTIFTPSNDCDLIPGITRKMVLQLIEEEQKTSMEKGKFTLDHLFNADAAWICNSVREILPVQQIDGHTFETKHVLLKELQERFSIFRDANLKPLKPQ